VPLAAPPLELSLELLEPQAETEIPSASAADAANAARVVRERVDAVLGLSMLSIPTFSMILVNNGAAQ
jgi:hypothetical protein